MLYKNNYTHKNLAILGSAFNPPHLGHADVIRQCLSWADSVILVPNYAHAFGKELVNFDQRVILSEALVEYASKEMQTDKISVSAIEKKLAQKKQLDNTKSAIYTFDVLEQFEQLYSQHILYFVLGPDNTAPETWKRFYKSDEIIERWNIWPAKENVSIRSTHVRNSIKNISKDEQITHSKHLQKMCPPNVLKLIEQFNLYR